MVESYQKFIEMYDKWTVYISKGRCIWALDDDFGKLLELVEKWTVIEYKKNDFEDNDEKNFRFKKWFRIIRKSFRKTKRI